MPDNKNPCEPCAYFIAKGDHEWGIRLDACICPTRLKLTETEYRATNHGGPTCNHFDKGRQMRIEEFE